MNNYRIDFGYYDYQSGGDQMIEHSSTDQSIINNFDQIRDLDTLLDTFDYLVNRSVRIQQATGLLTMQYIKAIYNNEIIKCWINPAHY